MASGSEFILSSQDAAERPTSQLADDLARVATVAVLA
jgi:hypothetical protein